MTMDPLGLMRDTAYDPADPWPVLRMASGLYACAGSGPGIWWQVDLRGVVPACRCRRAGWRGATCWHVLETQRQVAQWARQARTGTSAGPSLDAAVHELCG